MSTPEPARPFLLRLPDGRVWSGAEFPGGFVCVHHPDEHNVCTIAVSVNGLLEGGSPNDPVRDATVEYQD